MFVCRAGREGRPRSQACSKAVEQLTLPAEGPGKVSVQDVMAKGSTTAPVGCIPPSPLIGILDPSGGHQGSPGKCKLVSHPRFDRQWQWVWLGRRHVA